MRPGRRPKAPKLAKAPDPTQGDVLAALLMSAPPERQQQLIDAIWDRACGVRFWAGAKKPGGKDIGGKERQVRLTDLLTGEEIEGWIYEIPGAPDSQKLLVEHGIGRPPVRETAKQDPVIQLIHRVPGKRDWKAPVSDACTVPRASETGETAAADTGEHSAAVPGSGVLMIGGQAYGSGAVFQPEPEDEPIERQD